MINDTCGFDVGRRLSHVDDPKKIGSSANRRLLGVQRLGHDCTIGTAVLDDQDRPTGFGTLLR